MAAIAPVLALLALAAVPAPSRPAAEPPELRAVAVVIPPAVMRDDGRLTGFSVELWDELARRLDVRTRYVIVPDAAAVDRALRSGEADVSVTGTFYSLARLREFDFSAPVLDSGLRIMVPGRGDVRPGEERPLETFERVLFSRTMLYWVLAAVALSAIAAHVFWLLDRGAPDGIAGARYRSGIVDAMEWTTEAMLTQAPRMPGRRLARVLAPAWIFAGVVFVALLTAHMTAAITVDRLRSSITGPADLRGRSVAVIASTPSVEFVRELGAHVTELPTAADAFAAVASGRVDAAVAAAPALRYWATHEGAGRVHLVGPEFRAAPLGFVVRIDSPLRRQIDTALLELRDDGTYQRIHDRWFGQD